MATAGGHLGYARVHVALEVDRKPGEVAIVITRSRMIVAGDQSVLVEGQITAAPRKDCGILSEKIVYDTNGQLLTGSLMDYALPTAGDIPSMRLVHQHTPSPLNPLGVKGVGEGGAVGPSAAIANAVCDALASFGVEVNATPVDPEQLVRAVAG